MASPQESFLQGHPERKSDGDVLFCAECSIITMGRLSSKEIHATVTLVVTEKALYEFKGSSTKPKENKRIEWNQLGALLLSNERDTRFVICLVDNSYRTYEMFTITSKKTIVDSLKERCESNSISLPVVELPDIHIARVLKASQSKRGSRSNVWASLLITNDKPAVLESTNSEANLSLEVNFPRKSNLNESDLSAGISPSSSGILGGDRVGGIGNIGPMTLIWRRLENAVQPHLTVVTEDTTALSVIEKLKTNLGTENSPFSALGVPRDSGSAVIALSSVMMDPQSCQNLAKLFPANKAPAFLSSLESNLGCGDPLVRRWSALSLTLGLPVFGDLGHFPNNSGWQQAVNALSSQVRKRENAAVQLLFPAHTTEKEPENKVDVGDVLMVNSSTNTKDEKSSEKVGRFGKLRVMTSKNESKPLPTTSIIESRKGSRLNFAFSVSEGDTDNLAMESSDRRIRGALALAWLARLLDLESGSRNEGIEKSDVQTMFQLLLGKYPDPNTGDDSVRNLDFEVETFGATVESPEFFPSIASSLTATRNEDIRCIGLKQMNVLVMRNAPAIKAFLAIPDWQSVVLSSLYNVPYKPELRNAYQDEAYSYALHLATTLHLAVLGSKSPASEFGPIDKLMGQTIYKIAVTSGWGDPAISVVRSIFKGIISTLSKQAAAPTCTWRHNPMNDEWEELFRFSHLLQTFLFYRPANMGLKDVPALVAEASIKVARGDPTGEYNDWRSRVNFVPLLNRVHNERLLAAHRQIYAKLNLPIMTAAHRGDDTGIHLDESGKCSDRSLVEAAIKLWNALGITGSLKDDQKKSDEFVNKADRSRILYASNVCRELYEVLKLFDTIDEKRSQVLKKKEGVDRSSKHLSASASSGIIQGPQRDQVQAIAFSKATDFLEKQKKKETNVGFLTKAKTKNQATNLRSNILQKREVAIRKLGSGSDKLQPQLPATGPISVSSSGRSGAGSHTAKLQIRADDVIRTPFLTPKPEDDVKTIFEQESLAKASSSDRATTAVEEKPSRRTLVKLRKTEAQKGDLATQSTAAILEPIITTPPPILEFTGDKKSSLVISRRRSRAPECHGCGLPINEVVQEVHKFNHYWHGDCLVCSKCHRNIVTKDEPDNVLETCRYFPVAELLLCSKQCRDDVLCQQNDARCPGCMDGFNVNENTIQACGYSWHVDSKCFRCTICDTAFDEQTPYFEVQGWPYCKACLDNKFLHCKTCGQPLLDTDKVVEAREAQYHEKCFACSVCHEPFREDNYFVGQKGELLCFNHYLQKRTPPCAACHLPLNHKRGSDGVPEDPISMTGLTFHRSCFKCSKCDRKLLADAKPGSDDEPNEHAGMLFCPDCYMEEYGIKCRACNKGIRGDILHAGIGKHGETINWHPACFNCDECKCSLIEIPFYLVTVGDDEVVPVCFDHYQSRYGNRKCPGCNSFVSPGRSRQMSQAEDIDPDHDINAYLKKDNDRRTSVALSIGHQDDSNPAIMFADAMWHARCLTCDEPGCGARLFDEQALASSNLLQIETADGKKYCSEHIENHLSKCFTCKKGIHEFEARAELMGWYFHDRVECFRCCKCKGAIESGQALLKLEEGPAHQNCPSKRKSMWKLFTG